MSQTVQNYITENLNKDTKFSESWSEISNFYSKKLWHQLTIFIENILNNSEFRDGIDLKGFYDNLITSFEARMNSLALARISIIISQQILKKNNPEQSIEFLQSITTKVCGINTKEATVLLLTEIGLIYLYKLNDMVNARDIREKADTILNDLDGVSSAHAPFYKLSSAYYSVLKNYSAYYREALKYLGCLREEQLAALPAAEKEEWAVKLCVSALLGKDIYNFGELLMHEVMDCVSDENRFLVDAVRGFNEGDLDRLGTLTAHMQQQPDLARELPFLQEKMTLMSLVETIFQRPVNQRTISLADVSIATRVQSDNVELFIMKAMSKGLIKGYIDEVEQLLDVKWVQPRVLNRVQILTAQNNVKTWITSVVGMMKVVNENAHEILG